MMKSKDLSARGMISSSKFFSQHTVEGMTVRQRQALMPSALALTVALSAFFVPFNVAQAANTAMTGGLNLSTPGINEAYIFGSHGSVVLSGDDDFCGSDHVVGRNDFTDSITPEEQYRRFLVNQDFNGYHPYGNNTAQRQVDWFTQGRTTDKYLGYMGPQVDNAGSGGELNLMPKAWGVYSFVTGCGARATGNYSVAFGAGAVALAAGA
ncbi:hypothetical protein [Bartonella sp. DGB2]|uniref:hypothetical protein n=1 Tax=Bartonella sp. DGB2 TaxID=3388426 RepID=UPI00398FE151